MVISQCRESKRVVFPRVLLVPDANECLVEKADDGGEHLVLREFLSANVACDMPPNLLQGLSKRRHSVELCFVASFPPLGVILVLLSTASVPSDSLYVPIGRWADPDFSP